MNDLMTKVPAKAPQKAISDDDLMTPEDIAVLIKKPVRYVREQLIQTGRLPAVCFGRNSYRVERREFRLMLEREKPEPVAQTV